MNELKKIIKKRKQKKMFEKEAMIKAEFGIVERDGDIWLTHCGVAFRKITAHTSANEIATILNTARETALEFERL